MFYIFQYSEVRFRNQTTTVTCSILFRQSLDICLQYITQILDTEKINIAHCGDDTLYSETHCVPCCLRKIVACIYYSLLLQFFNRQIKQKCFCLGVRKYVKKDFCWDFEFKVGSPQLMCIPFFNATLHKLCRENLFHQLSACQSPSSQLCTWFPHTWQLVACWALSVIK